MAIKYYSNPKTKETFAVLSNCEMDAINKINKFMHDTDLCWASKKYLMPKTFKVKVKLAEGDEFDEKKGREYAKAKLMERYYKAFDTRIDMFKESLISLNSRVFETPAEIFENTP